MDIKIVEIRDKQVIEHFLREDPYMHLYGLGDLDDFFWPGTRWISFQVNGKILSIIFLYEDVQMPVLHALNPGVRLPLVMENMHIGHLLPEKCNAHLTPDFRLILEQDFEVESSGFHLKMALTDWEKTEKFAADDVFRITINNLEEVVELYQAGYPHTWFNERMLETGWYFGIRRDDRIVSVAGIHVYSEKYRVAALGNITTHPDYRNLGIAGQVTAGLCRKISSHVDHIGLNVHSENIAAIKCYEQVGFRVTGVYEECRLVKRKVEQNLV